MPRADGKDWLFLDCQTNHASWTNDEAIRNVIDLVETRHPVRLSRRRRVATHIAYQSDKLLIINFVTFKENVYIHVDLLCDPDSLAVD